MSEYHVPSHFLEEQQNGEEFNDLLDLSAFDEEQLGAEFAENQVLGLPDESTNLQDIGTSATPDINEQDEHTEVLLGEEQTNEGLTEEFPDFQFDYFSAKEWQDYVENAADLDIEDILGTGVQEGQKPLGHEQGRNAGVQNPSDVAQGSSVNTPAVDSGYGTAASFTDNTHDVTPATPYQVDNAIGNSCSQNVQVASNATTTAAASSATKNPVVIEDQNSEESDEESEEDDVSNSVNFETYREDDPLITPDVPQKGWGRTGNRNGQEVWFNPETSKWQPSASHHDMRATLIERAQAEYPDDRYLHPDPTDGLPHGETAFFKPHQNRGPNRDQCADELFVWREYQSKKDENGKRLRKKGKPIYTNGDHPGYMYEGDKILLDPHDNPVVNHKFIPLTLSAYTDAGKLQEMALKPGCRQTDLWARMPRWEQKTDKNGRTRTIFLRDKNTRVNMPMTRFREKKGTIAGGDREGTAVIMAGLRRFYHHHGFNPVASGNSVKAFPRDLLPWEVKEVRLGNTARFGERAGNRALDDEKRESNMQKTLKAIENGKKRQAEDNGDGARKRRLEDDDADLPDNGTGPQKRRRRGQEVNSGPVEAYAGPQGASIDQHDPNVHVPIPQGYLHGQDDGVSFATQPIQGNFTPYGALETPFELSAAQAQPLPMQHWSDFDRTFPNFGAYPTPVQASVQYSPYGGVHLRATGQPYESTQGQVHLNNYTVNNGYHPGGWYPQNSTGIGLASTFRPVAPHQDPRVNNRHEGFGRGPQNMAQNGMLSDMNSGYLTSAYDGSNRHTAASQRRTHFESADTAPRPVGNTLGPGGQRMHQAPEQALGKRRQQDAGIVENAEDRGSHAATNAGWPVPVAPYNNYGPRTSANTNGTGQGHSNAQALAAGNLGSANKRRRQNPTPDTESRQRQRQPQRTRPSSHYGTWGAPTPLMPPDEFFGPTSPTSDSHGNADDRLKSPGELFRELGNVFGGPDPIPTRDESLNQGLSGVPTWRPEHFPHHPQTYEPRQVLEQHGREEPVGQWGQDVYIPPQNPGQQHPQDHFSALEQNIHIPGPKRRRMAQSEQYHVPPVQAPVAPIFINQPIFNSDPSPQVVGAVRAPPQNLYTNGTPIDVGGHYQVANFQGPNPLYAPMRPQPVRQALTDLRDVRPMTGRQSQSLDNALRYTREAYQEWTGQEAPVTNLEDSYNVQYREIRAAFRAWWRSEENPRRLEPQPELWRMKPWGGTFEGWKAPQNREHLRESIRRGKQAG